MKYLILLHSTEDAWPPEEHRAAIEESVNLCHALNAKGQYVSAHPLQPSKLSTCVRVRDGKPEVIDGPFSETKEQLGGYFLIEVANLEEAIAVAAQIPGSRRGTAEIRPVMELSNLPKVGMSDAE